MILYVMNVQHPRTAPPQMAKMGYVAGSDSHVCLNDAFNDEDSDGICGDVDNCPFDPNVDQTDSRVCSVNLTHPV